MSTSPSDDRPLPHAEHHHHDDSTGASSRTAVNDADPNDLEALREENSKLKEILYQAEQEVIELRDNYGAFQKSFETIVNRLVIASEYHDRTIDRHIRRIGRYTMILAKDLKLSESDSRMLELSAPMHDVGKVGIPRRILMKPGKLTEEEFAIMQNHTVIGGKMLSNAESKLLATARKVALTHHEHWDGSGYPTHSRGEKIPLCGRIVGLVDAFDALTSARPHKVAYPIEIAFELINRNKGKRFDPLLVESMQNNLDAFIRTKAEIDTPQSMPGMEFQLSERDHPSAHIFHAYRFS